MAHIRIIQAGTLVIASILAFFGMVNLAILIMLGNAVVLLANIS